MRILVTGGTGAVGSQFVAAASARGHTLLSLSRREPSRPVPGVTYAVGSLAAPPMEVVTAFRPEACVHLAWIAVPGEYLESPENQDWVTWSESLLNALRESGVGRFVVAGTCAEYGVTGAPLDEQSSPLHPCSTYARCKVELHSRLNTRFGGSGVSLAWARLFYPYGEAEHPARLASTLVSRLRRGETVELRTPGSIKDFIHLQDVGEALVTVVERGWNGPINVGTGCGVSVETFARQIARAVGRPDLVRVAENRMPDPLGFMVADATRLRSLEWSPKVSLETGIHRLVEARAS